MTGKQGTPAWMAEKSLQHLRRLRELVPLRVVSAVFSIVWNRRATHRRLQRRTSTTNKCQLGCGSNAEDSIEHYARELGRRYLRLDPNRQVNLHTFVFCNPHVTTNSDLTVAALLVYTTYRATNQQRFQSTLLNGDSIFASMKQWAREGARGHCRLSMGTSSTRHFDQRQAQGRRHRRVLQRILRRRLRRKLQRIIQHTTPTNAPPNAPMNIPTKTPTKIPMDASTNTRGRLQRILRQRPRRKHK